METLLAMLMLWIAENSTYETAGMPLPDVELMSSVELTREYYDGQLDLMPASKIDDRVRALYAFADGDYGTIYLLDQEADKAHEKLEDPVFQERLLHELVHHVQRLAGAYDDYGCIAMGEKEAYFLGGEYLRQRYTEDPLPNRLQLAYLYSRC